MDEDGTATGSQVAMDKVADFSEHGEHVHCLGVFAVLEEVIAFDDELPIPGLAPVDIWSADQGDYGGDVVRFDD